MTIPLFGEFLAAASEQIDAAVSFPGELPGRARPAAIRQLGRLISALARYATDITLPDEFDPAGPPPSAHERAAANARLALLRAAEHAQLAAHGAASARADAGHPVVRHLSGAADHLAAGRDLLQTHLTPAGAGAGSSPWAPVITSPPVTTALIAELARYAHRLAPWMSQLALARTPDSAVPAPACLALHTASGWLWAAGPAMATAALPHPAATTSRRLLGAVPASTPPPRHRIGGTDTVAGLCAGAASTAERLRHAMPVAASQLRWSPTATSLSWRRDALAAAILGHTSELLLRSLASRAGHRETDSAITAGLDRAADAAGQAWPAWRAVAHVWDIVTTGASSAISPVTAELADLVLWTGRLACDNPRWTPASGDASRLRGPADLAGSPGDVTAVLAATALQGSRSAVRSPAPGPRGLVDVHEAARVRPRAVWWIRVMASLNSGSERPASLRWWVM